MDIYCIFIHIYFLISLVLSFLYISLFFYLTFLFSFLSFLSCFLCSFLFKPARVSLLYGHKEKRSKREKIGTKIDEEKQAKMTGEKIGR